jgi:hypothetical protein
LRDANLVCFEAEKRCDTPWSGLNRLRGNFFNAEIIRDEFYVRLRCAAASPCSPYTNCLGVLGAEGGPSALAGSKAVRVFVLGGTGSIGCRTVREFVRRGHQVWALPRSDLSATKLRSSGATPSGDIALPEQRIAKLQRVDAVVYAACDFRTGMGAIDARLLRGCRDTDAHNEQMPKNEKPACQRAFVKLCQT